MSGTRPPADGNGEAERGRGSWWSRVTARMEPPVFFGSAFVVVAFVVFGSAFTETASAFFDGVQSFFVRSFAWLMVLVVGLAVILVVSLAGSRLGKIRLGDPSDTPEFSTTGWLAMLFSAGMGTGLVFFGVAEPMTHTHEPPLGAEAGSADAMREAMSLTLLHWGVHAWAIYAVFAIGLALFHFRLRLPLAPRSLLWPLIGRRIHGPIGHTVDLVCTVGTLIGVAASLGLGSLQINAGLEHMGFAGRSTSVQVIIIAVITAIATVSVVSGLQHGIRRLSQLNLVLALLLLLFVMSAGPTIELLNFMVTSIGAYLDGLPRLSFWVAPGGGDAQAWQRDWTLAYWGWWLAWSPFVGVFVARISRGRTVRELVVALLVVPVAGSIVWMGVFGGAGLTVLGGDPVQVEAVTAEPAIALHTLLDAMPWSAITGVVATVLTVIFFVTSSDSGSLVDDIVTSGGHPDPPRAQRVFWAVSEGAVAATLVLAGGLDALRTATLAIGLPMALLLVVASISLLRGLQEVLRGSR